MKPKTNQPLLYNISGKARLEVRNSVSGIEFRNGVSGIPDRRAQASYRMQYEIPSPPQPFMALSLGRLDIFDI